MGKDGLWGVGTRFEWDCMGDCMGATWGTFMVPHGHAHGACETKRSRQWLSVRVDVLRMCCERTWWLCWGRQDGQSGLIQAPNVRAFYRQGGL